MKGKAAKRAKAKVAANESTESSMAGHVFASTVTFKEIISEVVYCWDLSEAVQKHKSDNGVSVFLCA
jgi:hypothetical protein